MRRGLLEGVLYRQASNHIRLGKGEFSGVSNAGLRIMVNRRDELCVKPTGTRSPSQIRPLGSGTPHFTGLPPAQPPQKLLATALSRFLRFTTFSSTKGLISGRRPGYSKEVPK